jgi:phospholipid/cholesterol/gamma-HCH transport system substrate-binding protein
MKRTNDFVVGLVIVVAIVAIIGATLWMNETDISGRSGRTVAAFRDVGNVRVGAHVVIRGVHAGRIQSMELAPGGWVHVRMQVEPGVELPSDAVVLLNEASLFGEWQATIMSRAALPRDEEIARQVAEASTAQRGLIPGATLPDIAKLTAVAGRIAGDVANVADRFQVAFDDAAAKELRQSIRNVAELSNVLAQTVRVQSRNLDGMSSEVEKGVASLSEAAADVKAIAERFDSSTARGEVKRVVDDAATAARELREASRRLLALSGQLGKSQESLESFLSRGDSVMAKINRGDGSLGLMVNDPTLYHRSDSLMRELLALVSDIHKNPKKYVNVRIF